MKTILVPTDFSPNADLALDYAAALAQKTGAQLMIVHGCTLLNDRYARYKTLIQEANEAQVSGLTHDLNELSERVTGKWNVVASVHLMQTDNITECIVEMGKEQADLLVMGTYGKTGLRRRLFGSKAADIINRSVKPVLTIPPDYSWQPPDRIAVAVDEAETATDLYRPAFDLAHLFNAQVFLVGFSHTDAEAYELVNRSHTLESLCRRLSTLDPAVRIEPVNLYGENLQLSLNQFVDEHHVRLLCMVTSERSFWQQLVDGSLTQEMSYVSKVPLLSLHRKSE